MTRRRRKSAAKWEPFDPAWLVRLAELREPGQAWLAEALSRCTSVLRNQHHDDCLYFVDPSEPNEPGSEWQFVTNLVLESAPDIYDDDRAVILDVLAGQRIGGLEFF